VAPVGTPIPARIRHLRAPALATAALLTPLLTASPASAATTGVTSYAQLTTAFSDANADTVRLDADIAYSWETTHASGIVTNSHTLTLDLHGHTLSVFNVNITPGTTLRIVDTGSAGTLRVTPDIYGGYAGIDTTGATLEIYSGTIIANGSASGGAGIGSAAGHDAGTFRMLGGTVTATSGDWSAAIGGGENGGAGSITINGGTVTANGRGDGPGIGNGPHYAGDATASVNIMGGTVTATSSTNRQRTFAVGGGNGASGVALTVGAAATLTISHDEKTWGLGGDVQNSRQWGSYAIAGTLILDASVPIPANESISILPGGVVRGPGAFQKNPALGTGDATIYNDGTLLAHADSSIVVAGNNFTVNFDANRSGATAVWPASLHIYAPTLADAGFILPSPPIAGSTLARGWNTDPNGRGTAFTAATVVTEDLTVYADWPLRGSLPPVGGNDDTSTPTTTPTRVLAATGDTLSPTIALAALLALLAGVALVLRRRTRA